MIVEGISDIRIAGMDENRPPRLRKEPYIDLYFRLLHKAPPDWCVGFNDLLAKHEFAPKINTEEGLFIETWVRSPDEIAGLLLILKEKVTECTAQYIEKIALSKRDAASDNELLQKEGEGEQGRLNRVIAGLDFNDE
jgi:hypothetical protein